MILHYLKIAFRNLWKYKVQNLIGILGVAVGIVCFAWCGYIIRFYLDKDSSYPGADRIYKLKIEPYGGGLVGSERLIADQFPNDVEKTTCMDWDHFNAQIQLKDQQEIPYDILLAEADTSFLSFFSLSFTEGDEQTVKQTENSVILFEHIARKISNTQSLVGSTILLSGNPFRITGILRDLPPSSSLDDNNHGFIFNRIHNSQLKRDEKDRNFYGNALFIMLRKGVDPKLFQKKINDLKNIVTDSDIQNGASGKLQIFRFDNINNRQLQITLGIFALVGTLILLTSSVYYISFLIAQFYNRLKECAIRKANGSGRLQTFWLFYTEFMLALSIAILISLVIIDFFQPYFNPILEEVSIDAFYISQTIKIQLLQYLIVGSIIGLLLCLLPARTIDRLSVQKIVLGISKKGKKSTVQNFVLFLQMVIFLAFTTTALIAHLQITKFRSEIYASLTPGEKESIISYISYDGPYLNGKRDILIQKIQSSPWVEDCIYTQSPASGYTRWRYIQTPFSENQLIKEYRVSSRFFDFFKIKKKAGSFFDDTTDTHQAVVDEVFASLDADENPLNKTLIIGEETFRINSITQMVRTEIKNNIIQSGEKAPAVFLPVDPKWNYFILYVKSVPGKQQEVKQHMEKCIREFLPEQLPTTFRIFSEEINEYHLEREVFIGKLASLFGVIAMIICFLGLYSSIVMRTEKQRKEVAIRKINGATLREILVLFCKNYVILYSLAFVLVMPFVYLLGNKWLEEYSVRISLNTLFFTGIYIVFFLLIILTIIFRILKVAKENPAEVVKTE